MTMFNALALAPAWLSVAVASSKDKTRPQLDRTVSIEAFHTGVRLTATDSYTLLTAWVPNLDHDFEPPPPPLDEAPYATAVAMDPHGRARGLLGHALGLAHRAEKDDLPPVTLSLLLGVVDEVEESVAPMFAGMEVPMVVLELPDAERVKLATFGGEFPNWRSVLPGMRAKRTAGVALASDRMAQMAKLAKYHEARPLRFTFGGSNQAVRVEVTDTTIEGVVMPVQWDFDLDVPRSDDVVVAEFAAELADVDPEDFG